MIQNGPQNQSYSEAEGDGGQQIGANHVAVAGGILGAIVTAAWVLPSVVENWDHWWMKLIVCAFGIATSYGVYALLRQGAKYRHHKAVVVAVVFGLLYFAVLGAALAGGVMPEFTSNSKVRFIIPALLTLITVASWYRSFRPATKATIAQPATSPAQESASAPPTTQPAPTTAPATQHAVRRVPSFADIESIVRNGRHFCEAITATPRNAGESSNLGLKATDALKQIHIAFSPGVTPGGIQCISFTGWSSAVTEPLGEIHRLAVGIARSLGWQQLLEGFGLNLYSNGTAPWATGEALDLAQRLAKSIDCLWNEAMVVQYGNAFASPKTALSQPPLPAPTAPAETAPADQSRRAWDGVRTLAPDDKRALKAALARFVGQKFRCLYVHRGDHAYFDCMNFAIQLSEVLFACGWTGPDGGGVETTPVQPFGGDNKDMACLPGIAVAISDHTDTHAIVEQAAIDLVRTLDSRGVLTVQNGPPPHKEIMRHVAQPLQLITIVVGPKPEIQASNNQTFAKPPISKSNPGRSFITLSGVDDWPTGHVFTEYEFRKKRPDRPPYANTPTEIDDYYEELYERLLKLKCIQLVPT